MAWTRRRFIKNGLYAAIAYLVLDAFWIEKMFIEINEFYLEGATAQESKIKLLQISDLHIQSVSYKLRKLAGKINIIKPDLILITGDAVDDHSKLNVLNEFLKLLDQDIKKVAILGNWEYWGKVDLQKLSAIYSDNNCDLLINSSKQFSFNDKTLSITGVDDYVGGNADILVALKDYISSDYHLILNHCPQYADVIVQSLSVEIKANFILSGHTHGGQVNLFGFVPFKPRGSGRYLKGWYTLNSNQLYVSKGIGTSILPIRFMSRAEIAVFNVG